MKIRSAGFVNPGRKASLKMREAAVVAGFSLETHRSQLVTPELLEWADKIVFMDGGNHRRLLAAGAVPSRLIGLGSHCTPVLPRIADPAFLRKGSLEFQQVVAELLQGSFALREALVK